jgi:hypothetical protein
MKKGYVIIVGIMLVIISYAGLVSANNEEEDQKQEVYDDSCRIYGDPASCYQQFKPSFEQLTRIKVLLEKPGGAQTSFKKYYLAVKQGGWATQPLTLTYIDGSQVTSTTPVWYEFDFPDIDLDKDTTYGIQMYGVDYNPAAAAVRWCYADHDVYGYGNGYTDDDGDGSFSPIYGDFTFITIGIREKTKTKEFNNLINPFLEFLEQHPHLFPILQRILGMQ